MPSFFIPPCQGQFHPALAAGQPNVGTFVDINTGAIVTAPNADGPNLVQEWEVTSFYIPTSVWALATGGGPPAVPAPSVCDLTLEASVNGEPIWFAQRLISMVTTPSGGLSSANVVITDDLFNPIYLKAGQKFSFAYGLFFDQPVALNSWDIYLGETLDPTTLAFQTRAAPVRYSVSYDQRVRASR